VTITARTGEAPGRGQRLPRSQRRAQLLSVALEVFVGQGYHAAAMDDIADRAGVSKPVLYQHFPSKLDLYLALLDAGADALVAAVQRALDSTQDNKQRVTATIAAYLDFVDAPDTPFRLVFESDLMNEVAVRQRVDRADDACARLVSRVIAADTGLTEPEAMLLASGLTGMAQTAARHWLRSGHDVPKDLAARLVGSLGWRGISGFPLSHPPQP
jgi:AcrR family transcriptional regulator